MFLSELHGVVRVTVRIVIRFLLRYLRFFKYSFRMTFGFDRFLWYLRRFLALPIMLRIAQLGRLLRVLVVHIYRLGDVCQDRDQVVPTVLNYMVGGSVLIRRVRSSIQRLVFLSLCVQAGASPIASFASNGNVGSVNRTIEDANGEAIHVLLNMVGNLSTTSTKSMVFKDHRFRNSVMQRIANDLCRAFSVDA